MQWQWKWQSVKRSRKVLPLLPGIDSIGCLQFFLVPAQTNLPKQTVTQHSCTTVDGLTSWWHYIGLIQNSHILHIFILKHLLFFFCLFQTEKPERRHTFASLALRKRYSYLTDPAASEFTILTYFCCFSDIYVILSSLI